MRVRVSASQTLCGTGTTSRLHVKESVQPIEYGENKPKLTNVTLSQIEGSGVDRHESQRVLDTGTSVEQRSLYFRGCVQCVRLETRDVG